MPEISEEDLATYQRAYGLLDSLWKDNKNGLAFKRMVKEKNPDAHIAEIDIAEPMLKPVQDEVNNLRTENKSLLDRMEAWETKEKQKQEDAEMQTLLTNVQKQYKLTDDGMTKVIARMRDKNSLDAEAAAAWVRSQEPAPRPVSSGYAPSNMDLFGVSTESEDSRTKLLHQDPIKFFDTEVAAVLDEFARGAAE